MMNKRNHDGQVIPAAMALLILTTSASLGGQRSTGGQGLGFGYDRPARSPHGSRSEVIAPHGIVAASQPLAAQVGIDILKAGGNAIDAAVAVNATLGVVEPHMNGIGGDLFAIVWDAATQRLYALNATGRSPYDFSREQVLAQGLEQVPGSGPLSWMVPGAVDGWNELLERFGTMDFEQVLAPAIGYARDGFPVSEIIAGNWKAAERSLSRWPDSARTYLPWGRAPTVGEVFKNPDLARSYELIAAQGRDGFYKGPIAEQIVTFSKANGGYMSMRDFADHTSSWVEPVNTSYRGYRVWELPPNSHGITALMMLNILEGFDLRSMSHNSAEAIHVIVEAKKLAFADRAKYVADPQFNSLPTAQLISKEYGASRRKLIDLGHASSTFTAGDPFESGDTVYLCVVDKDRNAVSLIQSNFDAFGSKVVPGDVGFVMQNRARGFSMEPHHLNTLESHKRSLHTNMPGMVTKDGKPFLVFGVMGGNMQPQGHAQVLSNIIDFGMNVQEAGDAARIRHVPDSPEAVARVGGGTILMESGVPEEVAVLLRRLGHQVQRVDGGQMGGYQAILIDPVTGMLHGGTDPCKDGMAIGY
ncbi:MAG: gamma-glutamyltransferase [Acidobacteriota bacterium]